MVKVKAAHVLVFGFTVFGLFYFNKNSNSAEAEDPCIIDLAKVSAKNNKLQEQIEVMKSQKQALQQQLEQLQAKPAPIPPVADTSAQEIEKSTAPTGSTAAKHTAKSWSWNDTYDLKLIDDTTDPYNNYMQALRPEWGTGLNTPKNLIAQGKCASGTESLIFKGETTVQNKHIKIGAEDEYHYDAQKPEELPLDKIKNVLREEGSIVLDKAVPEDLFLDSRKLVRNLLEQEWDKHTCMLQTKWDLNDLKNGTHSLDLDAMFALSELPSVRTVLDNVIGKDDYYIVWFQISHNREIVPWHQDQRNGDWYGRMRKFHVFKAMIYLQDHRLFPALSLVPGTQFLHRSSPAYGANNLRSNDTVLHFLTPPGSLIIHDYRNVHMNHLFPNEPVPHVLVQFTYAKKKSPEARAILLNRFASDSMQKVVRAYHENKYKNGTGKIDFEKKHGWIPKRKKKYSIDNH